MIVPNDWSYDDQTKAVRYIGDSHGGVSPSYATVIQLHRWLGDLADDATYQGDDEMDITKETPSDRSTDNIITLINGVNIDDLAAEHLFDGSIIQDNGDTIYDGIVNFGNTSKINIMQNGALIPNDFWNSYTPAGFNGDADQGISHRFLVKVRDAGATIDGRRLLGMSRQENKGWSEFPINGTSRGNNVLALSEADDLNNQTPSSEIATWTDIVNDIEGYAPIDINGDGNSEFYFSDWELGSRSINDLYERSKWLGQDGTSETLYGLPGDIFRGITHEIALSSASQVGTFTEPELVTWATGSGQLLAIDDPAGGTKMFIQLLTGIAPTDTQTLTGSDSGATSEVDVNVIAYTVAIPFIGQSTGSAIIGAYGIGVGADDLSANDRVTDLTGTLNIPPNIVVFSVNGVVSGEDRVLVGPESGGTLNKSQMTLLNTLDSADVSTIEMSAAIPTDTPASGTIRVTDDEGLERRIQYSSYSGAIFTIDSTDGNEDFDVVAAASGNGAYVSYIDRLATASSESFSSVYNMDRPLFIRVRDGAGTPIRTFQTTGSLGSSGGAATVIRTSDE